jgi:hypothetical protein
VKKNDENGIQIDVNGQKIVVSTPTEAKTEKMQLDSGMKYIELAQIGKICGYGLDEFAHKMGLSPITLYKRIAAARDGRRSELVELFMVAKIVELVGENDVETALEELRMPKAERDVVQNTKRITWGEAKKMLRICGATQKAFAAEIRLTPSGVGRHINWYSRRRIPLPDIRGLRRVLGDKNFDQALAIVRNKEEKHKTPIGLQPKEGL